MHRWLLPSGPREGIVVNVGDLRLYWYEPGQAPRSFPIGVAKDGFATPTGVTEVKAKRASKATEAEWGELTRRGNAALEPVVARLQRDAGSHNRGRKCCCGRDFATYAAPANC